MWRQRWYGCWIALAVMLAGCAEKTEQEQLDDLRHSLAYKGYARLSDDGIKLSYEAYRQGERLAGKPMPPALDAQTLCWMHLLIAYTTISAGKSVPTVAESDLLERDCDLPGAMVAHALRSVVFEREKWPVLARQEGDLAWQATPDPASAFTLLLLMHMVLAEVAVQDQRWDRVVVHVDALAVMLHVVWLGELGHAGLDFKEGRYLQGLRRVKRLSANPVVPAEVRQMLQGMISDIEASTGDVDSRLVLARVIGLVLWDVAKQQAPPALGSVMRFVEQHAIKPVQNVSRQGWRGWLDRCRRWVGRWRGGTPDSSEELTPAGRDGDVPVPAAS